MSEEKKLPLLIAELSDLDLVNYHLDGFIMPIKGFCGYDSRSFDLDEVGVICNYCSNNNILKIAKLDKIISDDELDNLHKTLEALSKLNIDYYMYTDIAVLAYFSKLNLKDKLIFASSKMVASFNEAKYYEEEGISCIPSTEISFEEIKKICSLSNICLTCYGYLDIFYSKRKLVSLFKESKNIKSLFNSKGIYRIKEENRNEENIILENENGTYIYSDFVYLLYRELAFLNPKFLKINSFNVNKHDLFRIIDIYHDSIENGPNTNGYEELLDINGLVGSGFLYLKANILNEV